MWPCIFCITSQEGPEPCFVRGGAPDIITDLLLKDFLLNTIYCINLHIIFNHVKLKLVIIDGF